MCLFRGKVDRSPPPLSPSSDPVRKKKRTTTSLSAFKQERQKLEKVRREKRTSGGKRCSYNFPRGERGFSFLSPLWKKESEGWTGADERERGPAEWSARLGVLRQTRDDTEKGGGRWDIHSFWSFCAMSMRGREGGVRRAVAPWYLRNEKSCR